MSEPLPTATTVLSADEVTTKKLLVCSISLGAAIIRNMVGTSIAANGDTKDIEQLMATAILNELGV